MRIGNSVSRISIGALGVLWVTGWAWNAPSCALDAPSDGPTSSYCTARFPVRVPR